MTRRDPSAREAEPCDLCGEHAARVRFRLGDEAHQPGDYAATTDAFMRYGRIVACAGCGLVRRSPREDWSQLAAGYRAVEDQPYLDEADGRLATARRTVRELERWSPPGRLLDVGCGAGVLLAAAAPRWTGTGVELSTWAVQTAKERYGLDVRQGTLEEAAFPDGHFDAVTLLDVIEHLPHPGAVVREVGRVLKPGGVLFVVTPDIGAPMARLMGRWWWGLRPAHLYYFSRPTLKSLLEQQGFTVRTTRHWGRRFTLGYWISRMRSYAPSLVGAVSRIAGATRLAGLPVYLNTFDTMCVVAVKGGASR